MKDSITAKQAEKILKADVANIVKKVAAGKTLTRDERMILRKAQGEGEAEGAAIVKNYTELAAILGVSRHSIQRWRKIEGAPKPSANGCHCLEKWRAFREKHGLKGAGSEGDPEHEKGLPSEPILKRRKLKLFCEEKEIELARKRAELIAVETVREELAKKVKQAHAILKGMFDEKLARKVAGCAAVEIYDANVKVLDEFFAMMSAGK